MATTEDWAKLETAAQVWGQSRCIIDLRRRVEALEQRAAAPAPAADRPLWEAMSQARYNSDGPRMASVRLATAAEIDAVADWLEGKGYLRGWELLRAEARLVREGA